MQVILYRKRGVMIRFSCICMILPSSGTSADLVRGKEPHVSYVFFLHVNWDMNLWKMLV